ncbi:hypothetical protein MTO96_043323 [Rhipicephalus appendiculatus]
MIPGRGASTTSDRRIRASQKRENALAVCSSVGEEEASAGEAAVPKAVCQRGDREWKLVQSKKRRGKATALRKQERICELCRYIEGKVLAATAAKSFRKQGYLLNWILSERPSHSFGSPWTRRCLGTYEFTWPGEPDSADAIRKIYATCIFGEKLNKCHLQSLKPEHDSGHGHHTCCHGC